MTTLRASLVVALLVLAPAAAAADPDAVLMLSTGFGADSTVDADGCGEASRTLFAVDVLAGRDDAKLAAGIGLAHLGVSTAYCDDDQRTGDASGFEARAIVGAARGWRDGRILVFVRLVGGLEVLQLGTSVSSMDGVTQSGSSQSYGPIAEGSAAAGKVYGKYTIGFGMGLGVAWPRGDESLHWTPRFGIQFTMRVFVGLDL